MTAPLAERLRPKNLTDYVGQKHILGAGKPLAVAIARNQPFSMLLWGEAGCGKTSLALLLAESFSAQFIRLSAVFSGVKEVRKAIEKAQNSPKKTILFIDEIHRFNKTQQDSLLPYIEDGTIIFIGATTENPAFHLNNALLSRLRVLHLKPLSVAELLPRLKAACESLQFSPQEKDLITLATMANGDARKALNDLEEWANLSNQGVSAKQALQTLFSDYLPHLDRQGEQFYQLLSAFHKSLRGSNPDGALYWFARMIEGGGDPLVIARRMLCVASEDIGNADPNALNLALNAYQTFQRLGAPEGYLALGQTITYLALAPKSNASYLAMNAAFDFVRKSPSFPVPQHLRNATTALQHAEKDGVGYRYAHHEPQAYAAGQTYLPPEMADVQFYAPNPRGLEIKLAEKLEKLRMLDHQAWESGQSQ